MAEKEKIIKEKVEHSGIFNFSDFYAYAHTWLKDENYGVVEEKYSEKVSGNARDISIEWKASKKLSDYVKAELGIKFDIKELVDVEVDMDGKKKKMHKGKVSVDISGIMIKDPESEWDASPFYRLLKGIYNKYIIHKKISDAEDKISSDVMTLKDELKAFLELLGKR